MKKKEEEKITKLNKIKKMKTNYINQVVQCNFGAKHFNSLSHIYQGRRTLFCDWGWLFCGKRLQFMQGWWTLINMQSVHIFSSMHSRSIFFSQNSIPTSAHATLAKVQGWLLSGKKPICWTNQCQETCDSSWVLLSSQSLKRNIGLVGWCDCWERFGVNCGMSELALVPCHDQHNKFTESTLSW